jgi:hypothetical protein
MSSEISTKEVRLKPDSTTLAAPGADPGLQPWQFFVLAALGCATAVTFVARGQGPVAVVLLAILMATAAFVGFTALRMLRPLVSPEDDRTVMIGQRTRVALEREKMLALRSIKELEFDRAMGRLSDEDWNEMSGRLRVRAARLIRQLDAGVGYRDQIERELAKRVADGNARLKPSRSEEREQPARSEDEASARLKPSRSEEREKPSRAEEDSAERLCAACETANDADAKFCKGCGAKL